MENQPNMFCYQCQETVRGKGCEQKGVCGKHAGTSTKMDLLLYAVSGISAINRALRAKGQASTEASHAVMDSLFTTITNANFDNDSIDDYIRRAFDVKKYLLGKAKEQRVDLPELPHVEFFATPDEAEKYKAVTGVLAEKNEDIRGLKQLAIYGCKGMAAYARHAANLGYEDDEVYAVIENAMAETARTDIGIGELLPLVMKVGDGGVNVMALLDRANTETYGNPEITKVDIGVRNRPGILISGHDLKDLEENSLNRPPEKALMYILTPRCFPVNTIRRSRNILILPVITETRGGARPMSSKNSTAYFCSHPIASYPRVADAHISIAYIRPVW